MLLLKIGTVAQVFNLLLPICRMTKTSIMDEIVFLFFRCIFVFCTMGYTDETWGPWLLVAFISIGMVEFVRYLFYIDKQNKGMKLNSRSTILLGHLRYNLPVILVPIGQLTCLVAGFFSLGNISKEWWGMYYIMFFCAIGVSSYR